MMENILNMTRRQVMKALAATAGTQATSRLAFAENASSMTAAQVVDIIKKHLNMTWNDKTYRDTFKAGDPNTAVKGIASCFMSTFDVIKKAHAQGLNFVITHEPTFWTDADLIEPIKNDPMYLEKLHYVENNGMVVWRIHDHWHRYIPEPMTQGMEGLLGWKEAESGKRFYKFDQPRKLRDVAEEVAVKLYTRSVRILGDPELMISTVARGGHTLSGNIEALNEADVAIASEIREWESVEYMRDLIATGAKKGFVVLSHEAGEEEGMVVFTKWMKNVTPDIRTVFISTDDRMYFA
jgi:putative NIF3 family GTP cyclohydrolase 1 type 2